MDRGKIIAIATGAISIFIAIIYLIVVILLDSRGEMIPAPVDMSTILRIFQIILGFSIPYSQFFG